MKKTTVFWVGAVLLSAIGVLYKPSTWIQKPLTWHLIVGSSVGHGTLEGSVGDVFGNLDDCLKAWNEHKAETDRLNQGVPRSPEYQTTAYCVDGDTKQRFNIQTP